MDEWKYINVEDIIVKYDQFKSDSIGIFLSDNYTHINGRNNASASVDLVHNINTHSYRTEDNKLLITRRKEFSYPLSNPNNKMNIFHDEITLISSDKKNIENFVKNLKNNFEED